MPAPPACPGAFTALGSSPFPASSHQTLLPSWLVLLPAQPRPPYHLVTHSPPHLSPAPPAPQRPGSPPTSPAPGSSALGAVHPTRVPSPGSVPALVPHRDQGQLPPLGPARLLQPLRGSRGLSPCRALIPVFAHPQSPHSPMVGAVEGAPLQPGAPGPFPALAPDACGSWSLCTVSAALLPRTWSPVPGGVKSLPPVP